MKCPVCKVQLIVVERHKIELDYCISCKGFWFDRGELNLLSETLGLDLIKELQTTQLNEYSEKPRDCPLCDNRMDKIKLGQNTNVVIDKCPQGQGMWFDGGELSRIVNQNREISGLGNKEMINFLGEFLVQG
ncbi:MAG TPA: zf-TFIIB domain-containing protein [Thermodesulfobacteriota bacterium]|nr:zf-TFIIB domain-containing protein [Thermodesulfobacteriota bacterium]